MNYCDYNTILMLIECELNLYYKKRIVDIYA